MWRGINAEVKLALLAVVSRETFQEERAKSRASTATNRMEDHEALETSALVGELSNTVKGDIDEFLADGVVSSGVVVGGVFLAGDELFGMEELLILSSSHFVDDSRFQVDVNAARNILSTAGFREESVRGVINRLLSSKFAIRSDSMFECEKFPAGVSYLRASLTDVDRNDLAVR